MEELKRILTVDVKTTSQYERKLVCADDPRPSAKGIGIIFGPVLISVVIGLIVLADFPNLVKAAIRLKRAIMRMNKYRKNKYKQDKDKKDDSSGQSQNNEDTKEEKNSQEKTPDSTNSSNENPEKNAKTKTAWSEQSKTVPLNNRPRPPYLRNSVPKRVENKFPKNRLNVKVFSYVIRKSLQYYIITTMSGSQSQGLLYLINLSCDRMRTSRSVSQSQGLLYLIYLF